MNGKRVGDDVLTPEFTDYKKRILYQTYDVGALLTNGRNAIGAILGDGWALSAQMWNGVRMAFLSPPPLISGLYVIEYTDGAHDDIVSDETWKAAQSPIYHAEIYAAKFTTRGWSRPAGTPRDLPTLRGPPQWRSPLRRGPSRPR